LAATDLFDPGQAGAASGRVGLVGGGDVSLSVSGSMVPGVLLGLVEAPIFVEVSARSQRPELEHRLCACEAPP
jgi:hypothetical protein